MSTRPSAVSTGRIAAAVLRRVCPNSVFKKAFMFLRTPARTSKNVSIEPLSVRVSVIRANWIRNSPNAGSELLRFSPILWNISVTTLSWSKKTPNSGLSARVINPPTMLPSKLKNFVPFTAASAKNSLRGLLSIVFSSSNFLVTSFR